MMAQPAYSWIPEHLDCLSLEEAIHLRVRLELERRTPLGDELTTLEQKAYRQIYPRLVDLFVFTDGYPFDYLRSFRPQAWCSSHKSFYVLLLDRGGLQEGPVRHKPGRSDMPAFYVGQTDNPIEQRLQEHLVGYHSALCIHHHFIGLLPLIYDRYNPKPHGETVLEVEAALAEALHRTGCSVFGAH